jgi:hypothetical protein
VDIPTDYRVTEDGQVYLLEANPNPDISCGEDFSEAAEHSGVKYECLLQKIITLGLNGHSRVLGPEVSTVKEASSVSRPLLSSIILSNS